MNLDIKMVDQSLENGIYLMLLIDQTQLNQDHASLDVCVKIKSIVTPVFHLGMVPVQTGLQKSLPVLEHEKESSLTQVGRCGLGLACTPGRSLSIGTEGLDGLLWICI